MTHFNHIPVASYVCSKAIRDIGSYKLMCYTTKPQINGKRVMPDARSLQFLSYDKAASHQMAVGSLTKMGLSTRTDAIHIYDNHVFNAETITMPFGKYKGLLLDEIYTKDPNYIAWLANTVKPTSYINRLIQMQCALWATVTHSDPIVEFKHAQLSVV
ncbi:putative quorum-sensing-regulated virulence factor [Shewanella aestuarii]|uniref:Exodeoxyribonuclease X-like C-terminal domain-containing protein n=1 Tax=Shewanella aestuarii TaxID=1028752 RepID=A0A6G9QRZ7_9GAMM|nr:DUF3820 family protein [Shewanella aestuarii]QIR16561.1 hypothetical protein HBH39_18980 [Shewanella aestuarii]